jgi:hypothetical protein
MAASSESGNKFSDFIKGEYLDQILKKNFAPRSFVSLRVHQYTAVLKCKGVPSL